MKNLIYFVKIIVVFILSFQVQAQKESKEPYFIVQDTKISLGYYYPSLSIISNKTDIAISLNYWIQELTKSIGINNVSSFLYSDISLMNHDFESGKLDMIIAPPLLIATIFDKELLLNGFVGVNSDHDLDNLVIIARKVKNKPFDGYKNKRLLLPEGDLLATIFLEKIILKNLESPLDSVFSKITIKTKDHRMVLDLFFNKADIAIVYESSLNVILELNPQIDKRIQVIQKFPLLARNFSYFHRDFPHQQKLLDGILLFNKKSRGKEILQIFNSDSIKICKVSFLDKFKYFYNEYLDLKKNNSTTN